MPFATDESTRAKSLRDLETSHLRLIWLLAYYEYWYHRLLPAAHMLVTASTTAKGLAPSVAIRCDYCDPEYYYVASSHPIARSGPS